MGFGNLVSSLLLIPRCGGRGSSLESKVKLHNGGGSDVVGSGLKVVAVNGDWCGGCTLVLSSVKEWWQNGWFGGRIQRIPYCQSSLFKGKGLWERQTA
ncbi:unnamed protein product [Ilex paraguariensis]|uniref:Uncharacterized protein n=1 Tax=Ilex paraguariensis TaxID=185542 RepID=A0ABC8SPR5_9AQUA